MPLCLGVAVGCLGTGLRVSRGWRRRSCRSVRGAACRGEEGLQGRTAAAGVIAVVLSLPRNTTLPVRGGRRLGEEAAASWCESTVRHLVVAVAIAVRGHVAVGEMGDAGSDAHVLPIEVAVCGTVGVERVGCRDQRHRGDHLRLPLGLPSAQEAGALGGHRFVLAAAGCQHRLGRGLGRLQRGCLAAAVHEDGTGSHHGRARGLGEQPSIVAFHAGGARRDRGRWGS
mmetsp:Transcript_1396/g.3448  ORF Transcript_1396/g.3448 Transcript_1396/m.3448 type:complete len:227 (+) Transcript_1396:1400-2080(+)